MDKSTLKDLILLFICTCFNGVFFNTGFLFTYSISYIKVFHPEYPVYLLFSVFLSMDAGLMIMSSIFPKIISWVSINNSFRIFAVLIALTSVVLIYWTSLLGMYVGYFLVGFSHRLMTMNLIYILNYKYKEQAVKFTGFVFTGTSICLGWGYIFSKIMNPANEPKTRKFVLPDGGFEHFFSETVSLRFPRMIGIYSACNVLVAVVISFFMSLPEKSHRAEDAENEVDLDSSFIECMSGTSETKKNAESIL